MGKLAISKPEHSNCTLKYQYSTDGGTTFSALEDVTDSFLKDRSKTHTGSVSGLVSFADDLVEVERFIIYYETATSLDKIYLSGLTQTAGLTFDVYADDVAVDAIPTTKVGSSISQAVTTRPRDTANELLTFAEITKTAFMIEIGGIQSYNGGDSANLLKNGDFESGDNGDWIISGTASVEDDLSYGWVGTLFGAGGGNSLSQSIDTTALGDVDFKLSFLARDVVGFISGIGGKVEVNSGAYVNEAIDSSMSNSIQEYIFTLPSSENTLTVQFSGGGAVDPAGLQFDNASLEINQEGVPVYIGSNLDKRGIFFGKEIFQPDYNFNYGAPLDNSYKHTNNSTRTSNYPHKTNSTRSDSLTLSNQTPSKLDDLEYLDYQLKENQGYCFYQRDVDSADAKDFFLANFSHSERTPDFFNQSSTQINLQEHHEWI